MTNILLEKKGLYAVATINRPKALNALNSEVLSDLDELVRTVSADADIRALVITGSGEKAFVAGADIGEMSTLTPAEGECIENELWNEKPVVIRNIPDSCCAVIRELCWLIAANEAHNRNTFFIGGRTENCKLFWDKYFIYLMEIRKYKKII